MIDFLKEYWLTFLMGLISTGLLTVLKIYYGKIKKLYESFSTEKSEQVLIKEALVSLIGSRITQYYEDYSSKGSCSVATLRSVTILYNHYTELGGHDEMVKGLFSALLALPHTKMYENSD